MSIYIKGVNMPTNCTDCRYRPLVGCNPYQDNGLSPSDHRHRTCPLTEVKEPHGRLIDADALYEYITNKVGGVDCAVLLDNEIAPTVIERSDDCDGDHREVWEYDGFEYFGETEPSKRKLCSTCKHRTPHVAYDTCDIDGHLMGQFEILKRCCDRWEKEDEYGDNR